MSDETPIGYILSVGQGEFGRPRFLDAGDGFVYASAWTRALRWDTVRAAEFARANSNWPKARIWPIYAHQNGNERRGRYPLTDAQVADLRRRGA